MVSDWLTAVLSANLTCVASELIFDRSMQGFQFTYSFSSLQQASALSGLIVTVLISSNLWDVMWRDVVFLNVDMSST